MDLEIFEKKEQEFVNNLQSINALPLVDNKNLPKWFKVKRIFPRTGKQGIIGLVDIITDDGKKVRSIFKISLYLNFMVDQEYSIMKSLNKLGGFCHNFCKSYGKAIVPLDTNYRKTNNPFDYTNKYPIQGDVLLMEYVDESRKFYRYIKHSKVENYVIFSIIKQTLSAISIAQKHNQFAHYDLHSNNIMVKECNPKTLFLYILDESHQLLIPSYGFYPVIIDFGFGYTGDMEGGPLYGSLAHTDVGFMSSLFDKFGDPKLFLTSVSWELNKYRKHDKGKEFRKYVKKIFEPLELDWDSGWDDASDMPAIDYVYYTLEDTFKQSKFFKKNGDLCVDLVQCLIDLPLKKRKYKEMPTTFKLVMEEFQKIENEIGSDYYLLYIFKKIIELAKTHKQAYMNDSTRVQAVKDFKIGIYEVLSSISKYCNPKLNAEKLLCGIILWAKQTEGILYNVCLERMQEKNRQYEKMTNKSVEDILSGIDNNFSDDYEISSEHEIIIINSITRERSLLVLTPEQIDTLNEIDSSERGEYIYKNYLQ